MTYIEAMTIARRELGWTEDEIEADDQFASTLSPKGRRLNEQQIPAGMEQQYIQDCKDLISDQEGCLQIVRQRLVQN